jgi:phytoene dehydrogenase-like protein
LSTQFDVVIIGCGHNGLTAGCYLAKSGLRVLALEQAPIVGGQVTTEELFPGYKINRCSIAHIGIFQTDILRELKLAKFGLGYVDLDPVLFAPFPDGRSLTIYKSLDKTVKQIAKLSAHDARTYRKFFRTWKGIADLVGAALASAPMPLNEVLRLLEGPEAEEIVWALLTSYGRVLDETFESDYVKAPLALLAAQAGPPPDEPGSGLFVMWNVTSHVAEVGMKMPRGGSGVLTQALAKCFQYHGGTIQVNTKALGIEVRNDRAVGVRLAGGKRIRAGVVLSAVDPTQTFLRLVDSDVLPDKLVHRLRSLKVEPNAVKVDCAISTPPKYRAAGHGAAHEALIAFQLICPSIDYLNRAYHESRVGRFSTHPALWVGTPSVADPTLAPRGRHVLYIQAQYAPYELDGGDWQTFKQEAGDRIIATLADYAPNVKSSILARQVESPPDLERRINITRGAVNHVHMSLDQLFNFRPAVGLSGYRTPIENLYLGASGAHPGGSVSGVPGLLSARTILEDWRKRLA